MGIFEEFEKIFEEYLRTFGAIGPLLEDIDVPSIRDQESKFDFGLHVASEANSDLRYGLYVPNSTWNHICLTLLGPHSASF